MQPHSLHGLLLASRSSRHKMSYSPTQRLQGQTECMLIKTAGTVGHAGVSAIAMSTATEGFVVRSLPPLPFTPG
jgi:hypothetical protein